jgi:hypothetical protein
MQGVADNFSTVALQSDQFDGNKLFKNVDFSGIAADDKTGRVSFGVSATLDPSIFSYASTLGSSAIVPITAPPVQATSTASSTFQ